MHVFEIKDIQEAPIQTEAQTVLRPRDKGNRNPWQREGAQSHQQKEGASAGADNTARRC